MDDLKVCRVCLGMDVTLNNLHSNSLEHYYELLTGTDPLLELKMPKYACYECSALLRKFFIFRQRSLKVQGMLQGILLENGQITEEDIKYKHLILNRSLCTARNVVNIGIQPTNDNFFTELADQVSVHTVEEKKVLTNQNMKMLVYIEDDSSSAIKTECVQSPILKREVSVSPRRDSMLNRPTTAIKMEVMSPSILDPTKPDSVHMAIDTKKDDKIEIDFCDDDSLNSDDMSTDDENYSLKTGKKTKTKSKSETKKIGKRKERVQRKRTDSQIKPELRDKDLEEFVIFIYLTKEEQLEELQKRRESEEYQKAQYKCDMCCKTFLNELSALNHAEKHDESRGSLECDICKLRFKTRRKFGQHYSAHPRRYVCRSCPRVLGSLYQARLHVRYHQGVEYKCPHCDEVHVNKSTYLNHLRSKHPADFTCELCGSAFVTQHGLNRHKKAKHRTEEGAAENSSEAQHCALCNIKFANSKAYERHKLTSQKHADITNEFSCLECGQVFPSNEERREHARLRHKRDLKLVPDARTWPIQCPHCPEMIPNAMANWSHYRLRHPGRRYPARDCHVCQQCGKGFATTAGLESHRGSHAAARAHRCECGKGFRHRDGLVKHRKSVHSELRPHMCSLCGRTFKLNSALVKHQRTHTGERPFKCEECGKSFGFSTTRNIHYRTVHLKLPNPYGERARKKKLPPNTDK